MSEDAHLDVLDEGAIFVPDFGWVVAVDYGGAGVKFWSENDTSGWYELDCRSEIDAGDYLELMFALALHCDTSDWWLKEVIPLLLQHQPSPFADYDIDVMTKLRLAARWAKAQDPAVLAE